MWRPAQNLVTSVKLKPRTFIAGTTMSNVSSPDARTAGESASTFDSISISPTLKRKLRTPADTSPPSTRNVPSRVMPVKIFWYGSTSRIYQSRVTRMPCSVDATISSTLMSPPAITIFMGASPVSLGSGNPCPVGATPARAAACRQYAISRTTPRSTRVKRRRAFGIECGARLQRIPRIVKDVDVLAEEFLADAVVEEAAPIADRGAAEIHEHLPHEIEHRRRLQNHRVPPRRQLARMVRRCRLARCRARQRQRVQRAPVAGAGLGPAGTVPRHGGDGEARHGLAVTRRHAMRIVQRRAALAR